MEVYFQKFTSGLSVLSLSHVNSVRVRQGQTEMSECAVPEGAAAAGPARQEIPLVLNWVKIGVSTMQSVWQRRQPSLTERFLLLAFFFWQMKRPLCLLVCIRKLLPLHRFGCMHGET